MKRIAVTQRVEIVPGYGERRDALDQRWTDFLASIDLLPLLVPNNPATLPGLLVDIPVDGILLTGARANVHPTRFGLEAHPRYEPYDSDRDELALALVHSCVERGAARGDRKSTRLNSSHQSTSRMPSSA